MQKLPSRLEREPLVEAIFEVRFGGAPQLANILPGALRAGMTPKPNITKLPASDIPEMIRVNDRNLTYAPLVMLEFESFTLSVGERNFVIGCKLPYPKWPAFKDEILKISKLVAEMELDSPVVRYSLKYINLIQASSIKDQISKISMTIRLGDCTATDDHAYVRIHKKEDDILHILSVSTGAEATDRDGTKRVGAIVDIDSIRNVETANFALLNAELSGLIESLRKANKIKFFNCLTEETVQELGPHYD